MSNVDLPTETLVWVDAPRLPLVQRVLGGMAGLRVLAVGGARKGEISELASNLDVPGYDDLRKMLIEHPAAYLFMGTAEEVGPEGLQAAFSQEVEVIALEPPVTQADQVHFNAPDNPKAGRVEVSPLLRLCPAWLAATEPEQVLGPIQSLSVTVLAPPASGSLYGRLYDAFDLVHHLLGMPELINASLIGPLSAPPDDLHAITGHLTANLQFGDKASVVVQVSDMAVVWQRRVTALGKGGQLELEDERFHLRGPEVDERNDLTATAGPLEAADLVARQWQRTIDSPHLPPRTNPRQVVACCQAALLSCRTGQIESPTTLLRIQGG